MLIPKYFQANRKLFSYQFLFQLVFFSFGVVMVLLINRFFNDEANYACMGTLMALCGILAGTAAQSNQVNFRLAVLMGETRRYYLLWGPLLSVVLTLQGWLTAFCLYQLERLLYRVLYPGFLEDLPVGRAFQWQILALSAVIISVVSLFFGAVYTKFGPKGAQIFWLFLCFCPIFLPQAVDRFQEGNTSLLARLGGLLFAIAGLLTPVLWVVVGVILLLLMLGFSIVVYRNAEVRM